MSQWKEYKLGDVVEVINGYAFKSSNFLSNKNDGALPVIKIKNVANGDVRIDNCQYHLYNSSLDKFTATKGDILIALTGNHPEIMTQVVGDVSRYKLGEKALINQRVAKIAAKNDANNDYIYYFLKDDSTHDYLASQSTGSANQANISKGDIENMPILLPPLPEQTAIAEVLSSLDDKIDLLHRQNKTLEQLAETLFRQWFVEEADERWENEKLGDAITFQRGHDLTRTNMLSGQYPVAGSNGIIGHHNLYTTKGPGITIGRSGNVGMPQYYDGDYWAHNTVLFIKEFKKVSPLFIYFYLKTIDFNQFNAGSSVPTLNRNHIHDLIFILPPKEKLISFDRTVQPLFQKIQSTKKQILNLIDMRDTLLPKLMNGEVRVKMN